jgi:hypothetical protein
MEHILSCRLRKCEQLEDFLDEKEEGLAEMHLKLCDFNSELTSAKSTFKCSIMKGIRHNSKIKLINNYTSVKSTSKCQIMKGIGHNSKIKLINNYIRRRLTLINADATLNQR